MALPGASAPPNWRGATGVFGGTFDPPHLGHLTAARMATTALGLESTWLLPAGAPALRGRPHLRAWHRWVLALAATAGDLRLRACPLELERLDSTYTFRTWQALKARWPSRRFVWLLGADAALQLVKWESAAQLLAECNFGVIARPGVELAGPWRLAELGYPAERTAWLPLHTPPLAARGLRRDMEHGEAKPRRDLPPAVAAAVLSGDLYPREV